MNDDLTLPDEVAAADTAGSNNEDRFFAVRLRRRSWTEWLAWLLWLSFLLIMLEYALNSFVEQEQQAGVLAGAIFLGVLIAGVMIEVIKAIEANSQYRDPLKNPDDDE